MELKLKPGEETESKQEYVSVTEKLMWHLKKPTKYTQLVAMVKMRKDTTNIVRRIPVGS